MRVKNIKVKSAALLFITALLAIWACEKSSTAPQTKETSVKFVFGQTISSPTDIWLNKLKRNELNLPGKIDGIPANKNRFNKSSAITEAYVLVLDMTRWLDESTFVNAWDSTGQESMVNYNLMDEKKDLWDNYLALFKSYSGDYYQYYGEYSLSIKDSVAKGTIGVNPGLNYFFIVLRENGKTAYWDARFWIIEKDRENIISFQPQSAIYTYIYSPQDSSVFQQGAQIYFSGYAYDEATLMDIPPENWIWISDKDGEIGRGTDFYLSTLSANQHLITLTAIAQSGAKGTAQVSITVTP
ncbi:MAG: hypothetical protein P8184_18730 [Calditrichia bacterium]